NTDVENLIYIGSAAFTGTGNSTGNAITGGSGNDTLYGDAGTDVLDGGIGNDKLNGGVDGDQLFGEVGNDTLNGQPGDEILNCGPGADVMKGGIGDDTYIVDNTKDAVKETAGAGVDTVHSLLTAYTLGAEVENLTYTGFASFSGTGNAFDNVITGGT